jgi:hypothetical protein
VSNVEGRKDEVLEIESALGTFTVRCEHKHQIGEPIRLLARPLPAESGPEPNLLSGVVADVIFQPDRFKVALDNGLYVYLSQAPKVGERIEVPVKVECLA